MSGPLLVALLALGWAATLVAAYATGYAHGRRRRPPQRVTFTLPRR